jgi:hypothetical protein
MSEEEFLSRWSRRKSEATEAALPSKSPAEVAAAPQPVEAPPAPEQRFAGAAKPAQEEEFDVSSLPSIDAITGATDITAFLRKGVPLELTRAALRRAWVTDPTIRDFVGLAENAWDFNDPNAMPGFGALDQTPEQVRQLVATIMGEVRREMDSVKPAAADNCSEQKPPVEANSASDEQSAVPLAQILTTAPSGANVTRREREPPSTQRRDEVPNDRGESPRSRRRTHGGALPR